MGSAHAKNIFDGKISNLELAAVCDADSTKEKWAKESLKDVPFYSDYQVMIKDKSIDAILIATPHYFHSEIAIFGFENGLHVLTEKPAGVFTKQVDEMNEKAKASNKVFCIMYNQRTNPIYKKVREMIKNNELGELIRGVWTITNWYRTQAYYDSGTWRATWKGEGGGVLINQCPHNLDLWQWMLGMPMKIKGFCGYGKFHNIEVEDDVTAYAEYKNGASFVFITSTGEFPGTNRLEISGDKGKLLIDNNQIKFWKLAKSVKEHCHSTKHGFEGIDYEVIDVDAFGAETGHNGILQNFTNAILFGEELIAPGAEGINGLTISNAIHLSDWTQKKVQLPIDSGLYVKLLKEKIEQSTVNKKTVQTEIADLSGTYNDRWDIKW